MAAEDEEAQYQKKLRKKVGEAIKSAQMEQQKKELMRQFLDAKAYERRSDEHKDIKL